jgi:hypothetical protein
MGKIKKYTQYAIGEILLVMIGIILALQVNNWNENRKARIVEQLLLENLKTEMSVNYEQLEKAMSFHAKSRNSARQLLEIFNGSHSYTRTEEVDSLLAQTQWAWTFDPSMGALNSIKMSGYLNAVQNSDLRTLITTYEDLSYDTMEEGKIIQDIIIDRYIPAVNQYVSLNQRLKFLGEDYVVGESKFEADYKGLFKDRLLEGIVSYIHTWRIDELGEEENLKKMMENFIATLSIEIEKD